MAVPVVVFANNAQYEINFANKNKAEIEVAVHYLDKAGQWQITGWTRIKPGQAARVANTRNSIFLYYARTTDKKLHWEGGGKERQNNYIYTVPGSRDSFLFRIVELDPKGFASYTFDLAD
jgi:uncharacterized membrane protein